MFRLIRDEGVTFLCAAPTVLIALANAPDALKAGVPKGVRVLTAGAPPAAATIQRVEEGLGWTVTQLYGLTETSPLMTFCDELPEHRTLAADARARQKARQGVEQITGGEVRVVDSTGAEVPADGETQGEIVVRGNVVMRGYYDDPDATAKVMGDGWFHSGDAAVVHPDSYIEIRDRIKDVIISGGENISSVEVEATLLRHDAVQEVGGGRDAAREVGRGAARLRRLPGRRRGAARGAARVLPRAVGALQGAAQFHAGHRAAEDGDRQDSEVRLAQGHGRTSPPSDGTRSRRRVAMTARPRARLPLVFTIGLMALAVASDADAPRYLGGASVVHAKPGRDLAVAAPESVGVSTERLKRLDAGIKSLVTDGKLAGAVTLLTRHGKTAHVGVHGVKDIRSGAPMTRDSIFRIYSMTKPVTGVAMLMLYEEGQVAPRRSGDAASFPSSASSRCGSARTPTARPRRSRRAAR